MAIEKWRQVHSRHRRRFSVLPHYDSQRPVFMRVHDAFRKHWIAGGRPPWCELLRTPQLDEAVIAAPRRAAQQP